MARFSLYFRFPQSYFLKFSTLKIGLIGFFLILIIGILGWFGQSIFQNFIHQNFPFRAQVVEILTSKEEPSKIQPEEEIIPSAAEPAKEMEKRAFPQRSGPAEPSPFLSLIEIQDEIDEISEKIDILSQEVTDWIEETQPLLEEDGEEIEDEEPEEREKEEVDEELEEGEIGQEIGQRLCEKISARQPIRDKIIINEVAWMGTPNSANDEWIELKNISGAEVNLAGWQLLGKDNQIKIIFNPQNPQPRVLRNGFWLFERTNDNSVPGVAADLIYTGALKNENEALYLFDEDCQLQDEVLANPNWPAGDNSSKRTMERRSDLNWQTSLNPGGTPKKENSSGYYPYSGGGTLPLKEKEPKISLSFTKENPVNKEIEVLLSVSGLKNAIYDVKVSIEKENQALSEIYNEKENNWQSSFNYLKEIFSGTSFEGKFKLKIKDDKKDFRGQTDILVRIRESGKTKYFEFIDKIKILEPELLPDITPPQIIFNLAPIQTSLSFPISWQAEDPILESATTSGLDGFFLQYSVTPSDIDGILYQDKDGNWQNWKEGEILEIGPDQNQLNLLGKDEAIYTFKIKAKDKIGNESNWVEVSTKISLPKIVLINEIQVDSKAGTGGTADDWVELYNPYDVDVSLAGWSIQKHSSDFPCSINKSFDSKTFSRNEGGIFTIPTKRFFLIVSTQANESLKNIADMTISWSLTNNNTIYLVRKEDKIESGDDADIVDKVGFGSACFPETNPAPGLADPPEGGKSIERKELGKDTSDNSQDFIIKENPTPTNSKGETLIVN
jgi:hypothetical protein